MGEDESWNSSLESVSRDKQVSKSVQCSPLYLEVKSDVNVQADTWSVCSPSQSSSSQWSSHDSGIEEIVAAEKVDLLWTWRKHPPLNHGDQVTKLQILCFLKNRRKQ